MEKIIVILCVVSSVGCSVIGIENHRWFVPAIMALGAAFVWHLVKYHPWKE